MSKLLRQSFVLLLLIQQLITILIQFIFRSHGNGVLHYFFSLRSIAHLVEKTCPEAKGYKAVILLSCNIRPFEPLFRIRFMLK